MTDRAPIPAEAFDEAVDRLDRDTLAEFVGRLEAAADGAADVDVDPPVVTVGDGDDRTRLLVAPDGLDPDAAGWDETDPAPDAIVVGPGASSVTHAEGPVRTTADLRHQLLYAASPDAAASIAEEFLGTPARSASYVPEPTPTVAAGDDRDATAPAAEPDSRPGRVEGSAAPAGSTAGAAGESQESRPPDTESEPTTAGAPIGAGVVVVGVLAVMILAVAGGVVYAAEVAPDGDAGAFAAPVPVDGGGLSEAEIRRRSRGPIDESGAVATATATPTPGGGNDSGGHPLVNDTEADRNVRPAPTCKRSFLHVVQIQVNALKYNNNSTDDGIRTVRRFASPRNRQTIQTFDEFARIIKNPTYSPMLTHDSAQFTPIQSSDDYAQVQVVTRENGTVTGQYYFRLRKVDGGEYDGCWMTDAVVSVPETTNFSGEVAGQSTGASNETS